MTERCSQSAIIESLHYLMELKLSNITKAKRIKLVTFVDSKITVVHDCCTNILELVLENLHLSAWARRLGMAETEKHDRQKITMQLSCITDWSMKQSHPQTVTTWNTLTTWNSHILRVTAETTCIGGTTQAVIDTRHVAWTRQEPMPDGLWCWSFAVYAWGS